jgi:L-ascorbate oxidase
VCTTALARRLLVAVTLVLAAPLHGQPRLDHVLEAAMVRGTIWNPWILRDDPVELRSYRGEGVTDGSFVGPTLRARPGDTLRLRLDNRIPGCGPAETTPHGCSNDTNIHTHGLWVSPAGNSDNVMLSIAPGTSFQYEFAIPAEHPAGTFWFHAHRHGNTTHQLSSGMAGALIVEGNRRPAADGPGDIDILLRDADGRAFRERVMLFQQLNYECRDGAGEVRRTKRTDGDDTRPWVCLDGEVGRTGPKTPAGPRSFWRHTGRYTAINGKVQPELPAQAGRFERWRMVHAGLRERVRFHLKRLDERAPPLRSVPAEEQDEWLARYCRGPVLPMWEFALDGLTRSEIRQTPIMVLSPGDRVDALAYFPDKGRYCLIHEPSRGAGGVARIKAIINAGEGRARSGDPAGLLKHTLVRAAERALAGPGHKAVRSGVIAALRDGLRLPAFVPHPTIVPAEITGRQSADFSNQPVAGRTNPDFPIDGKLHEHGRIDRWLPLGGVEEWHVSTSTLAQEDHQFHIHVNPFQIVSIVDKEGRDVIDPASPGHDPDFAGLAGQWRDGLPLKTGYRAVLRTRYERFVGDFVVHCHILLHGDLGMMQNVRIYLPGGPDDPANAHRAHR